MDHALWRDILLYLRRKHPACCRGWFEELRPVELNTGVLVVETGDDIKRQYLVRHCTDAFNEAAQSMTGALVVVRFVQTYRPDSTGAGRRPVGAGAGEPARAPGEAEASARVSDSSGRGSGRSGVASAWGDELDDDATVLSPDYSFRNFVTGPGNRLAHAASVAVANQPGEAYNPLFIHGGVGLGKTHLLQAICQTILSNNPVARIYYVSCDAFVNRFVDSVSRGEMADFRNHYRHVDVLVIDDIHFLADHTRTQEEFFHTFNALYQNRRQIVLSSDSAPSEIPQIEERLVSRFQWGLVAHVTKPCFETRLAIVRAKAATRDLRLDDEVAAFIAQRIESNARELEGALTTIQGHASLQGRPITLGLAHEVLGGAPEPVAARSISLEQIVNTVTAFYDVSFKELQSKKRSKSIAEPRQVSIYLARKHTRFSLQEIGGAFGGRDHTTVMHSIKVVEKRIGEDPRFAGQVHEIEAALTG